MFIAQSTLCHFCIPLRRDTDVSTEQTCRLVIDDLCRSSVCVIRPSGSLLFVPGGGWGELVQRVARGGEGDKWYVLAGKGMTYGCVHLWLNSDPHGMQCAKLRLNLVWNLSCVHNTLWAFVFFCMCCVDG